MRTFVALCGAVLMATGIAWAATAHAQEEAQPAPIELFNGQDFEGWKLFIPDESVDPTTVWSVRDGVVYCTGVPNGYMRTTEKYENYRLTFEWRWIGEPGNSGVLIHIQDVDEVWPKSIEGQLQHDNAGDFWVIGGTTFKEHTNPDSRRVVKKHPSNEKPIGEWNQYEVVCEGNTIRLYINGLLQNEATETTVTRGYIGLQSEGKPVEFRNIVLTPLPAGGAE